MNAQIKTITKHFVALEKSVPLKPIRTIADYEAAVEALNELLDAGAADEGHPLANLAATLGELIGDFDDQHYPAKEVSGIAMLKFLMTQHGLTQSELPEIGTQGVVSEVMSGKREINIRQVRGLKDRFGVSADAFV
jgi:HTH-type transcriptional regulator/antitoxin HigA